MPEPRADADPGAGASSTPGKPGKPTPANPRGLGARIQKRWRAWLRALHRDIGYLAVGFTVIYSLSGIAMNHIDDWDPNFHASEATRKIAPIADDLSDAEATRRIATVAGLSGKIDDVYRAGDEVRLTYADGIKVTAIGDTVTVQIRRDRLFFRVADWLHATRGKQAWKFIADLYAGLLFYLAISGIFMIKGKLGLRWRGAALMSLGLLAPVGYIVVSGGPGAQASEKLAVRPGEADPKPGIAPSQPATAPGKPATEPGKPATAPGKPATEPGKPGTEPGKPDDGITPLPPDDN